MPTDDLAQFCCRNPDCDLHGRRGEDNLLVIDHFGKSSHRLLYCRVCKDRFSEFKGTPFFNSKLPHDKVLAVLEHLAEGCGVRQTAVPGARAEENARAIVAEAKQRLGGRHPELMTSDE